MKKLLTVMLSAVYSLSLMLGLTALVPVAVHAADAPKTNTTKSAPVQSYKYVAQPEDSYSKMARKAIQTYGIVNKIKISNAKIIAAETWLTQAAGSPELKVGQGVEIKKDTVKTFVDKAQKLSATQESLWAKYTTNVNFNTNAVGQAK